MPKQYLPRQTQKTYPSPHVCIYCGAKENLSDEHIIPKALGGRWILPQASCSGCSAITSAFEGVCARPILGPLRLYYGFPTRRKKSRPKTMPLKVKLTSEQQDWSEVNVKQEDYPFLVLLPQYDLPEELTGVQTTGRRDSATKSFWIRGGNFGPEKAFLEMLCHRLQVCSIMPMATCSTPEWSLMLGRVDTNHVYD